jgi:fumarate hydratase class I
VSPEALRVLATEAMTDIAHLLRPGHLQQLSNILKDPEARAHCSPSKSAAADWACASQASPNDRFVALELLKNANVAAGMVLPGCQDTGARRSARRDCVTLTALARNRPGTAIVQGKRGQYVWTDGNDEEALSRGVFDTYVKRNLRYSQVQRLVAGAAARTAAASLTSAARRWRR